MNKRTVISEVVFLRALAILLVLLYHFNFNFFKNGFIGVDIFFFISGYLMTKLYAEGKISIKVFYLKRIKRIVPDFVVFIFLVLLLSILLSSPDHFLKTIKTLVFSTIFSSNFYFWHTTKDYWAESMHLNPLLHTWSLSLEMQFYLIFPLIFFFRNIAVYILIFLSLLSLVFIELFKYSDASFYLIFSRFIQFFIGYFFYFLKKNSKFSDLYFIFFILSLSYILLGVNLYIFPHYYGILISILSGGLILFNKPYYLEFLVNNKLTKFLSDISYSLFLIHYPILIFYNFYIQRDLILIEKFLLILISILCSAFTYHFVEKKFNKMSIEIFLKKYLINRFLPFIFFIIFFLLFLTNINFNKFQKLKNEQSIIENLNDISPRNKNLTYPYTPSNPKSNNAIVILGDSHAQDIFFSLKLINPKQNYIYIPSNLDCSEILTRKISIFKEKIFEIFNKYNWQNKLYNECNKPFLFLENYQKLNRVDSIFISYMWNEKEIYNLDNLIKKLEQTNNLYIFSRKISVPHILSAIHKVGTDNKDINEYFNKKKDTHNEINNKLKIKLNKKFKDIIYVDINKYICPTKTNCNFFYKEQPMYIDRTHFSLYGSEYLRNFNLN